MNNQTRQSFAHVARKKERHGQNGAALVIALLLLLLLTGMTVAMVLSTSSDMLINGYYRNFRGSFYAADSGLAIARQDMVNGILAAVPASFSTSVQPIPSGTEANVVSYINTTYGANYQTLNQGRATASWPAKYKIDTTKTSLTLASCSVVGGGGTCAAPKLKNGQANGNLEIDASLATISNAGSGGLVNVGSRINTLSIVGGRIQNRIKDIGTTTRNVFFDRRFAQNGFAPPWYPSTTVQSSASNTATMTTTIQRTKWFNRTNY